METARQKFLALQRRYEELKVRFHAAPDDPAKEAVLAELGRALGLLYLAAREMRAEAGRAGSPRPAEGGVPPAPPVPWAPAEGWSGPSRGIASRWLPRNRG